MEEEVLRCTILKELSNGDENPTLILEDTGFSKKEIITQLKFLESNHYINGTKFIASIIWYGKITPSGVKYLEDHYDIIK